MQKAKLHVKKQESVVEKNVFNRAPINRGIKRSLDCIELEELHPRKRVRLEMLNTNSSKNVQAIRKRKRDRDLVEHDFIHPDKKSRLDLVMLFGQEITRQEFEDEIFKFVRLCRCESDLNNPTFFDKLKIL